MKKRAVLMITAAALVIAAAVVGIGALPSPEAALRRLQSEADAVKFQPRLGPAFGRIESLPATEAPPQTSNDLLPPGSVAPLFSLVTPTGQKVALADLRGRVVLLEFSATWCPRCQAEASHLEHLASFFPSPRYSFVAINADSEDAASVYAFDRYFGVSFLSLLDPTGTPGSFHQQGGLGRVAVSYNVAAFPTFYVIDAAGRVTWGAKGEQPDALIEKELRKAGGE